MQYLAAHSRLAVTGLTAIMALSAARTVCADQIVNLLPNGGAERVDSTTGDPDGWSKASLPAIGLRMWRDAEMGRSGEASFAISNQHEYEQLVTNNWAHELRFVPRGRMIRALGFVRTKDAEAANICVQCWGPDDQLIGFASTPVLRATKEWTLVETERIVVPKGTTKLLIRAALTGKGIVWFDDLKLEIVGPPVVSDPGLAWTVPGRIVRRLPVVKDSMALAYIPNWNHGNIDNIGVASNDGGVRALMAWEKPTANEIKEPQYKFLLALYCREARGKAGKASVRCYEITSDWPEIVSWSEMPVTAEQPAAEAVFHRSQGWKLIDVTSLVRRATGAKDLYGVMLRMEAEDCALETAIEKPKEPCSDFRFVSREGIGEWENRRPVLLVVNSEQPPVDEPFLAQLPAVDAPALSTEEFLQYIEYLASLPESSVQAIPGAKDAEFAAQHAAGNAIEGAPSPGEQALQSHRAYQRFAVAYPLTPEGVTKMSGILSKSYLEAEQLDAAKRLTAATSRLARGSEVEYLAEINRAWIQDKCGEGDAAEARLRRVAAAELPATVDRRRSDILWVAPLMLGDVLYRHEKSVEAGSVYKELLDAIDEWASRHPEDREVAVSYALSAQRGRLNILLDKDLDDDVAIQRLIEEFEPRFPGHADPFTGSPAAALRADVAMRRKLRDQEKKATPDAAQGN